MISDDISSQTAQVTRRLLVATDWLEAHLGDDSLVVVDTRGANRFEKGHIPSSVNLPVARLDDPSHPIRGMVLPAAKLALLFGAAGIGNDSRVVLYDDNQGLSSARLFWALAYIGVLNAAILDGGFPKWQAERRSLSQNPSASGGPQPATLEPKTDASCLALKEDVLAALRDKSAVILDARSREEFAGELQMADRAGRIPGAVNLPWDETTTGGDISVFRSPQELRDLFSQVGLDPQRETIVYCQAGIRSAHAYFALRLAGYEKVRNYDGSWQEWGNDLQLPIEK